MPNLCAKDGETSTMTTSASLRRGSGRSYPITNGPFDGLGGHTSSTSINYRSHQPYNAAISMACTSSWTSSIGIQSVTGYPMAEWVSFPSPMASDARSAIIPYSQSCDGHTSVFALHNHHIVLSWLIWRTLKPSIQTTRQLSCLRS